MVEIQVGGYSSSGFYYAPVTKGLMIIQLLCFLFINVHEVARPGSGVLKFISPKTFMTIVNIVECVSFWNLTSFISGSYLLYKFRLFERRCGSLKFASRLLISFVLSEALLLVATAVAVTLINHNENESTAQFLQMRPAAAGMYAVVGSLVVPYVTELPRLPTTHILGVPVSGKIFTYIVILQLFTSNIEALFAGAVGVLIGLIFHINTQNIRNWMLPRSVGSVFSKTVGRLLSSGPPKPAPFPLGATLEIQREQQMELLEQQLMFDSRQFGRSNTRNQREFHQRGAMREDAVVPTESNVTKLVDMGFERPRAENALRIANNDVSAATNILLQEL